MEEVVVIYFNVIYQSVSEVLKGCEKSIDETRWSQGTAQNIKQTYTSDIIHLGNRNKYTRIYAIPARTFVTIPTASTSESINPYPANVENRVSS